MIMAYDRYDTRDGPRGERSRWRDERNGRDDRGRNEDRGFFERAGDEIASWFGDGEAERRRGDDQRTEGHGDWRRDEERGRHFGRGDFDHDRERGWFGGRGSYRGSTWGTEAAGEPGVERGYRPTLGGYTRGEGFFSAGGYPRESGSRDFER